MQQHSKGRDFWSRRRAGVQREEQEAHAHEVSVSRQAERAEMEDKRDSKILAELDLPDPESLKSGDDFYAFMAPAVPDRIRRGAGRSGSSGGPIVSWAIRTSFWIMETTSPTALWSWRISKRPIKSARYAASH